MTHVLFEEEGGFKAGTILSDAGSSLQVETVSARRIKIKNQHVLLRFESPGAAELITQAQDAARDIDVDFLWECAPAEEFGFQALAQEYFGHAPSAVESASLLMAVHAAPVYFHRRGRGQYRAAPPEVLKAAKAALERKRLQELQLEADAQALVERRLPESIGRQAAWLLVKPDKQSLEFRALDRACQRTGMAPARLLLECGAFESVHAMHLACFSAEWFPHGTGFPGGLAPGALPELAVADARPFSIDDSSTTEIDDCLSVTPLGQGRHRIGIHIAAPGCAIEPASPLDAVARERMSTVYMPGDKITMLPDDVVAAFSLDEGRIVPALSMYLDVDADTGELHGAYSVLESIRVAANLRNDQLDAVVTQQALEDPDAPLPFGEELRVLWRYTQALSAQRDRVRGKPEQRSRPDYSFYFEGDQVRIVQRRRDAPLDRIVAEMMILANSRWAGLMAEHGVAGIFRSQVGTRVRNTTQPLPHQSIGVPHYMWSSSPLRRYADLINQRQLLAVLSDRPPPFGANDAELFSALSAFETRAAAYGDFQNRIERFWCLRWLQQRESQRVEAVVVREDLVRLVDAPLYIRLPDMPVLAAGRRVRVDVMEFDEINIDVSARFLEVLPDGQDGAETDLDVDVEASAEPESTDGDGVPADAAASAEGTAAGAEQPSWPA